MSWQGIDEFVAVAETGSFTQATRKLNCSTAHVSRQITRLEERLGMKLFNRTTRKVALTHEGHIFCQHCRQLRNGLSLAEQALSHLKNKPQGKITLSAPVAYGEANILPLINNFVNLYPDIEVNVHLTNNNVNLLEEGYDLTIRIGKLKDSSLIAKKIASRTSYICATPDYLERFGSPITLSDLKDHNCLLGTLGYWNFQFEGKEKRLRVSGNIRYNSGFGLLDAALKGLGLVQLPDYYVTQYLDNKRLSTTLEKYRLPDEGIWAVFHHNNQLSPKIKHLIDFLTENLSPLKNIRKVNCENFS